MNNNDISSLISMLNKMDKNQLINYMNNISSNLSDDQKQKLIQIFNNQNKN